MDAAIGRLLTYLEKNNLRENTLVIFASDNGAAVQAPLKLFNCNAGFRGRKAQLYEGGIRVPFIVNQPGKVPVQSLNNIIYFPDVMPTLAALTGGTQYLPQNINGMNILPLFYGKQIDTDDRVLFIGNSQVSSVLRATVTGRLLPSSQTSLWNSIICVKTQKRNMISPRSIRKWLSALTR